jgi:hypothetical protein
MLSIELLDYLTDGKYIAAFKAKQNPEAHAKSKGKC